MEVAHFSEDFVNIPICSVSLNIHLFRVVNISVTLVLLFNTRVHFGGNKQDNYILVTNRKVTSNSVSRCIGLHCVISVKLWTILKENADFITKFILTSKQSYLKNY
jgi:hypothetical protein